MDTEPEPEPEPQPEPEPEPEPEAGRPDQLEPEPELQPQPEPEPELRFDRYGLASDCEHARLYEHEAAEAAKEAEREAKWAKMTGAWENYASEAATARRSAKLKRRCRKGIPVVHRGHAWFLLSGARDEMQRSPQVYHDYSRVQPCPESYENQIQLDIGRTITDHRVFRDPSGEGQRKLFRVLRAYAVYNHKVAYCQGMSYVAGMFLCQQGVTEEQAFWMLRQFMNDAKYNLCGLFEDGFPLLNAYLDTLTELLSADRRFAVAHAHITKEGVVPMMFAEKWLLTLFMYNWPYKIAVRMWDVIVSEGPTAFFGFALSVFQMTGQELLTMDTEQLLLFLTANAADGGFTRVITARGADRFMKLALGLEVKQATLDAIEDRLRVAAEQRSREATAESSPARGHRRQESMEGSASHIGAARPATRRRRGGGWCSSRPAGISD